MKSLLFATVLVGTLMLGSGCGVSNTIDRAVQRTGDVVGDAVGERVGQMIVGRFPDTWGAQYMQLYTSYLFNVAFHAGSYSVSQEPYETGEWTRWRVIDSGETTPDYIERAFLAETEEGNQWWRVKYTNTESDESIVLEGLFTPERDELVRLRGQFPGEEPKEMPVQEGTYGYAQPVQLTDESIEGATVGYEQVQVPAGSFRAQHVRYGEMGGTLEWWLNEDVPGGMVKYLRSTESGTDEEMSFDSWVVELSEYGDGAESELGVM